MVVSTTRIFLLLLLALAPLGEGFQCDVGDTSDARGPYKTCEANFCLTMYQADYVGFECFDEESSFPQFLSGDGKEDWYTGYDVHSQAFDFDEACKDLSRFYAVDERFFTIDNPNKMYCATLHDFNNEHIFCCCEDNNCNNVHEYNQHKARLQERGLFFANHHSAVEIGMHTPTNPNELKCQVNGSGTDHGCNQFCMAVKEREQSSGKLDSMRAIDRGCSVPTEFRLLSAPDVVLDQHEMCREMKEYYENEPEYLSYSFYHHYCVEYDGPRNLHFCCCTYNNCDNDEFNTRAEDHFFTHDNSYYRTLDEVYLSNFNRRGPPTPPPKPGQTPVPVQAPAKPVFNCAERLGPSVSTESSCERNRDRVFCIAAMLESNHDDWQYGCDKRLAPWMIQAGTGIRDEKDMGDLCIKIKSLHLHGKYKPYKGRVYCANVETDSKGPVRVCCSTNSVKTDGLNQYYDKDLPSLSLKPIEIKFEIVETTRAQGHLPARSTSTAAATGSDGQSTSNGSDFRTSPKPSHKEDPDKTSVWIGISVLLVVVIVVVIAVVAVVATRKKRKMHKKTKKGKKDKKKKSKREETSATETGTSASRIDKSTKGPSSNMSTVGTPSKKSTMKSSAETPTSKI